MPGVACAIAPASGPVGCAAALCHVCMPCGVRTAMVAATRLAGALAALVRDPTRGHANPLHYSCVTQLARPAWSVTNVSRWRAHRFGDMSLESPQFQWHGHSYWTTLPFRTKCFELDAISAFLTKIVSATGSASIAPTSRWHGHSFWTTVGAPQIAARQALRQRRLRLCKPLGSDECGFASP